LSRAFFITTMGCQMNEYDSDFMAQSLIRCGFSPVKDPAAADIILINTCTVRSKPEQKAFSLLGRMSGIKKKKPNLVLGVVGCMAQQKGPALMERFPQLDFVMGPRELGFIGEILKRVNVTGEKVVATRLDPAPPKPIHSHSYFRGRVTAYLSIMEGCNNFCSYCIVPFVRGREISRPPEDIFEEGESLIAQGVKEITLLGQNVNSYEWNAAEERWSFVELLKQFSLMDSLLRLRFTTSHPKDLSDALIQCFREIPTLCPHIHLPFQAGSNPVLKRMRRGYTREDYLELVRKLRAERPDIAITSDVMVGFPGETDQDFDLTLDFIRRVQFDSLFSFKYSDRPHTLAKKLNAKVDEKEKAARLKALQELQKQITLKKNKDLEGKRVQVLVEGPSKRGDQFSGRTGSNKIVNFSGEASQIGSLVTVKIKRGFLNSLQGEISSA